jgi:hypothetical protein
MILSPLILTALMRLSQDGFNSLRTFFLKIENQVMQMAFLFLAFVCSTFFAYQV